ncbi:MAG TPA: F0F1 ATP synthase subunit B [Stellaceae bacterium]|nr:F0F1 ATP synthase subunit B [Stellaceae bacterium]
MLHEIIADPEFWVAVAFVIAVAGIARKAAAPVAGALDARSAKIAAELDEARQLREEAQRMLGEYQRKQRDALKEAEQIVALARSEAERAAAQAERDLAAALERRQAQALEKIALAESKAAAEVRNTAVEVAVAAARRMLAQQLDAPRKSRLIDDAIAALPRLLH